MKPRHNTTEYLPQMLENGMTNAGFRCSRDPTPRRTPHQNQTPRLTNPSFNEAVAQNHGRQRTAHRVDILCLLLR